MNITAKQAREMVTITSGKEARGPLSILLTGNNVTGKTWSIRTLAACGKVLVLDYDQNASCFADLPNVSIVRFGKLPGIDPNSIWAIDEFVSHELQNMVTRDSIDFVVQDGLTSLTIMGLAAAAQEKGRFGKPPSLADWNMESNTTGLLCNKVGSLQGLRGIITICHTELVKDDLRGTLVERLALTGRILPKRVIGIYPEIYRAYTKGSGKERRFLWRVMPDEGIIARTQMNMMKEKEDIPQNFKPVVDLYEGEGG